MKQVEVLVQWKSFEATVRSCTQKSVSGLLYFWKTFSQNDSAKRIAKNTAGTEWKNFVYFKRFRNSPDINTSKTLRRLLKAVGAQLPNEAQIATQKVLLHSSLRRIGAKV